MAAAACSSLCGSLATYVTSRFMRSSMLSCFRLPAVGVSTCAPANAPPPTGPSNTQVSKQAALRRPRALLALRSAFVRSDRQLRVTDIVVSSTHFGADAIRQRTARGGAGDARGPPHTTQYTV